MKAVVIGAGGAIGSALARLLQENGYAVTGFSRRSQPQLDLLDEGTIRNASAMAGDDLSVVLDATGFLHDDRYQPEKSFGRIQADHFAHSLAVNAIGPALLMKHFLPRLSRRRAVFATLSARVGSIGDNRLGGWYSYRASKAALNQLVRTAAVELCRTNPAAICVALHPGTVETPLSRPFGRTGHDMKSPAEAARELLTVVERLEQSDSGHFLDYRGAVIPF